VIGDETARRLEARIIALERRVQALEADQTQGDRDRPSPSADARVKSLRDLAVSRDRSLTDSEQRKTIGDRQPPDVSFDEARPKSPSVEGIEPERKSAFDRKGYHRQYMRAWRRRKTLRRGDAPT
jgi:hypothetical protein